MKRSQLLFIYCSQSNNITQKHLMKGFSFNNKQILYTLEEDNKEELLKNPA
jgi:hypothetical protein